MRILKDEPTYAEAPAIAYKQNDKELVIELKVPGYTINDITVKKHRSGIKIVGKPNKSVGKGTFAPGFTNFFSIDDDKQYNFKNTELVALENGILQVTLPIAKEFQAVELTLKK